MKNSIINTKLSVITLSLFLLFLTSCGGGDFSSRSSSMATPSDSTTQWRNAGRDALTKKKQAENAAKEEDEQATTKRPSRSASSGLGISTASNLKYPDAVKKMVEVYRSRYDNSDDLPYGYSDSPAYKNLFNDPVFLKELDDAVDSYITKHLEDTKIDWNKNVRRYYQENKNPNIPLIVRKTN
jgi:hypothetical protein